MALKAIDTIWNGFKFRSRLEARWAVFMDVLGIPYQYEPEGFDLSEAGFYLPDFWLPQQNLWLEIKAEQPTPSEIYKASELAIQSGKHVVILYGALQTPEFDLFDGVETWIRKSSYSSIGFYGSTEDAFGADFAGMVEMCAYYLQSNGFDVSDFDGTFESAMKIKRADQIFIQQSRPEKRSVPLLAWSDPLLFWHFDGMNYGFRTALWHGGVPGWMQGKLPAAYRTAQQARFEHGATVLIKGENDGS